MQSTVIKYPVAIIIAAIVFVFSFATSAQAASYQLVELSRGDWMMNVAGNPAMIWNAQSQTWNMEPRISTFWDQSISPDRQQFCGRTILFTDGVRCRNTGNQNAWNNIRGIQSTSNVLSVAAHNDVIVAGLEDLSIQVWNPTLRQWTEEVAPQATTPHHSFSVALYGSTYCSMYEKATSINSYEYIIDCYQVGQVGAAPFFSTTLTNSIGGMFAFEMIGPDTVLAEINETLVHFNTTQSLHLINIRNGSDHSMSVVGNPLYFSMTQSADGRFVSWVELVHNGAVLTYVVKTWTPGQASAKVAATYYENIVIGFSRDNNKLWTIPIDGIWDANTPGVPAGWNGPIQIR